MFLTESETFFRYLLSNRTLPACGLQVFNDSITELYSVMRAMFYAQASKIHRLTGCKPSCHQSELQLEERYKSIASDESIRLSFVMMEEEYEVDQYPHGGIAARIG